MPHSNLLVVKINEFVDASEADITKPKYVH